MKKLLMICSAAALFYGDCAWGMDDIDPWKGTSSSNSDQFNAESSQNSSSPRVRSRRNSRQFNAESERESASPIAKSRRNSRENVRGSYQDAQTQTEQVQTSSQQSEENRFIKIESQYLQYHYVPSNNSKIGHATPTTLVPIIGDLRGWNDVAEIHYANDVSYDKLGNPKVILYRNKDNSCYIILRIEENKHGVFYGINERNIEMGRNSFAVYDVSEAVGSFTDNVKRLIYVDESGLYFVPAEENSVENVIDSYQKEGKFKFEGSVIKVSAIDGTITLDGTHITKDNFFDNWVLEGDKTVLSTKQPDKKEILRNFGDVMGRDSLNYFINRRFQLLKSKSKNGAEELVRNGTFSSILTKFGNGKTYKAAIRQVREKRGRVDNSIEKVIDYNRNLFKDPELRIRNVDSV